MLDDISLLERVKVTDDFTRGGGVVLIDYTGRQVGRKPLAHQRGEEKKGNDRRQHHAEGVDTSRQHSFLLTVSDCYYLF